MRLWSLHSFSNAVIYKGHNYPVWCLDTSPQSYYFASGSHDCTARLWNMEYNYPLRIFAGHLQDVDVSVIDWSLARMLIGEGWGTLGLQMSVRSSGYQNVS